MGRVLFVSTSTTVGGAEKTLCALATLLGGGHQTAGVVSLKAEGEYGRKLRAQGLSVRSLGVVNVPAPGDVGRLAAVIDELKPDLVHALMYQAIQLCRLAKSKTKRPFKLVSSPRVTYRTRSAFTRLVDRVLKGRDELLIAESESSRQYLVRVMGYDSSKVKVIHNGVDLAGWPASKLDRQRRRMELRLAGGDILIGAVGRLDEQKGFHHLVSAMPKLKGLPLKLVVLGAGPERARLEQLIKWFKLEDCVFLPGEQGEIASWLSAFDIFCLPSLWEGLPNALLEAMALGVPIVASAVDGVPEAITDGSTGRLVPPGDVPALAAALRELAEDPKLRERLGANAKTQVAERFTIRRMIADYEAAYTDVLGER